MVSSASAVETSKKVLRKSKLSIKIWPSKHELLGELVGSISLVKGGHTIVEFVR